MTIAPPQAATATRNARHHGRPLRGLMSTPSSQLFQGRFGRMFRSLPSARYGETEQQSRDALRRWAHR
jgi:hypothetical protein